MSQDIGIARTGTVRTTVYAARHADRLVGEEGELFTTTEAATMLGRSRPTLMKPVESGEIDDVKVGTHHRIPAEVILAFQRARRARRDKAAEALAEFSNEIGLVDRR